MAKLPEKSIPRLLDELNVEQYSRPYLGASVVGHPCPRYLIYTFYWCYKDTIEGKLNRIFRVGDFYEEFLINELKKLGIKITDSQTSVSGYKGHAGGHMDGILEWKGKRFLFDIKSMNHSNFLSWCRKGTLEDKPQYYSQLQYYMGRTGEENSMLICIDKDSSKVEVEEIPFDPNHFMFLEMKEESIIDLEPITNYNKISNNPTWYQCKFCSAKDVCHNGKAFAKNCRTCEHFCLDDNSVCSCSYHKENLSVEAQQKGCDNWTINPLLGGQYYDE